MSALSDALAAMDKSALGEFERYLYQHDVAKPALGFIKEALPWLERMREGMEAPLMVEPEKYDALCALIALAKPEEVGHAEH